MSIDLDYPLDASVFGQCLATCVTATQGLSLEGINNERVVHRNAPWDANLDYPNIVFSPRTDLVEYRGGDNEFCEVSYSVLMGMIFANEKPLTGGTGLMLNWRQQTRRLFSDKGPADLIGLRDLGDGSIFRRCTVTDGAAVVDEAVGKLLFASWWLLRFSVYEPNQ